MALAALTISAGAFATHRIIEIPAPTPGADMTGTIRQALTDAGAVKDGKVTVVFQPGAVYNSPVRPPRLSCAMCRTPPPAEKILTPQNTSACGSTG